MTITTCPHCRMRVLPRPDGTCPSCNGLVGQAEPAPRPSAAVIKRASKPAARKKAPAKAARPRPSAPPKARDVEALYLEYHQTAVGVRRETVRAFLPHLVGGVVLCAVCVGLSFFTWEEVLRVEMERQPSTASWVLIWTGVLLLLGSALLGAIRGHQWGKTLVRDLAQDRAGFPDFYKAFAGRVWPKEGMVTGPAYDKFLAILGKQ